MPNKLQLLCESVTCLDETGNSSNPTGDEMAFFGYGMRAFAPNEPDRNDAFASFVIPFTTIGSFAAGNTVSYSPLTRVLDVTLPNDVRDVKLMLWLVEVDDGNDARKNFEQMQRRFVNRILNEVNRLFRAEPREDGRLQWLPAFRNVAVALNDAAKHFEGGDEVLSGHLLEFTYNGRIGAHHSTDDVLSPYFVVRSNDRGGKYTMNLCWHFIPGRPYERPPVVRRP